MPTNACGGLSEHHARPPFSARYLELCAFVGGSAVELVLVLLRSGPQGPTTFYGRFGGVHTRDYWILECAFAIESMSIMVGEVYVV